MIAEREEIYPTIETTSNELNRRYAALPWRRNGEGVVQVLLVSLRGERKWELPEGVPLEDKSPAETAQRVAFEKGGVIGFPNVEPFTSYLRPKNIRGMETRYETEIFPLRVMGTLVSWPGHKRYKRIWLDLDRATKLADQRLSQAFSHAQVQSNLFTSEA